MKCCIYIAALLALVSCEPNSNLSFRNRHKNKYLQNKSNVFKPQRNQHTSSSDDTRRIFGGKLVTGIDEYPFMVILIRIYYENGEGWVKTCGATILNTKYLLSAAHCLQKAKPNFERFPANEFTAYVGGLSVERSLDNATVKQYFIHPQNEHYVDDKKFINTFDIAVIELDKELQFSSKISSVKLPSPLTTFDWTSRLPKRCILLGFGKTSFQLEYKYDIALLKVAEVEVVNPNNTTALDCQQITKICNIDVKHNENSHCNGDSGGPLMCDGVQVGIMSYGPEYCEPNLRAINTRVAYFVDWINTFIKGN